VIHLEFYMACFLGEPGKGGLPSGTSAKHRWCVCGHVSDVSTAGVRDTAPEGLPGDPSRKAA
jgi:hypothetical protein